MIDEALIVAIERLRDGLTELKLALRMKYSNPQRQVVDDKLRETTARIAENWVVNISNGRRWPKPSPQTTWPI